jgi:hypothetical protein
MGFHRLGPQSELRKKTRSTELKLDPRLEIAGVVMSNWPLCRNADRQERLAAFGRSRPHLYTSLLPSAQIGSQWHEAIDDEEGKDWSVSQRQRFTSFLL